ncbi:hypothetical protein [Serratia liquefaciens]|uniref:hypothetical protein n=1 Tax=Serratia liquefaciens TaxID=614 RepID=UPI0021C9CF1E|nr:hypothetical protein [Serratia liquefaciens]
MKWLPDPIVILGAATLIFAFLYQASSHELETTNLLVTSQKNTLAQQSGLISTLQEQDRKNRALAAEQQQREQQLRQQGERYQRALREALKNDKCGNSPMPAAVIDLLQQNTGAAATGSVVTP